MHQAIYLVGSNGTGGLIPADAVILVPAMPPLQPPPPIDPILLGLST
ncbi:hypothetical protein [Frigoriglobus tundricola]|nr:hypothetical protein [Frigoriglobus tundricola]